MREQRLRKDKLLVPGHTASKTLDLNPGLILEPEDEVARDLQSLWGAWDH